jgi:GH25 family lysozyme M1 (1,4-beta-N-acetylmuramidase)
MTVLGLDISNYTGPISKEQIACIKEHGIRHVVVRLSLEGGAKIALARQQIDTLVAAGLDVSGYVWCYLSSWNPEQTIKDTIALLEGRPMKWLWLDAEDADEAVAGAGSNQRWLLRAIAEIRAQGKQPGIYTAGWFWRPYMGNSDTFKDIPLWVATFDKEPDLGGWRPFGGWSPPAFGEQYEGSGQQAQCGLVGDLNIFDDRILTGMEGPVVPPVTEPDFKQALLEEMVGELASFADDRLRIAVREESIRNRAKALGLVLPERV